MKNLIVLNDDNKTVIDVKQVKCMYYYQKDGGSHHRIDFYFDDGLKITVAYDSEYYRNIDYNQILKLLEVKNITQKKRG